MRSAGVGSPVLMERDDELRILTDVLARAADGDGEAVVVRGPAGIGKTSLLEALAQRNEQLRTCRYRGRDSEAGQPFAAMVGLLDQAVFDTDPAVFRGASALSLPLFSEGERTDLHEFQLLHGLHWLTISLSEQRPLLLIVDDAQLADPQSLRFLRYLADRLAGHPIAVVVAARSATPAPPELDELTGAAHRRLEPQPLSPDATRDLVATLSGLDDHALDVVLPALTERTGGNPFYVCEFARHLAARGARLDEVPATIVESTDRRLATVGRAARSIAVAAATLGESAALGDIVELARVSTAEATSAIDELIGSELLDPTDPRHFRHPLLRDAVAGTVPPGHRLDLALLAAQLNSARHPVRSAEHLLQAAQLAPFDRPWVVPTLTAAATVTCGQGGSTRAVAYLELALGESLDTSAEITIRHQRGRLYDEAKDPKALDHLHRAWELSRDLTDAPAIEIVEAYATALFHAALLEQAGEVCRAALATVDQTCDYTPWLRLEAAALNAEAISRRNRGRPAELRPVVCGATTPAQRAVLAHVAWDAAVRAAAGHREVADLARRAIGGTALISEVGSASPVFIYAGSALAWTGEYQEVDEFATAGITAAVGSGSLVGVAYATALRAGNSVYRGAIDQAETDAHRVLDELANVDPMCFAMTVGWQIEVAVEREHCAGAMSMLEHYGLNGELPDIGTIDTLLLSRARLFAALGNHERALADLAEVSERGHRSAYLNPVASPWRSMTATVRSLQGTFDTRCRDLLEAELTEARRYGAPRAVGQALLARAQLRSGAAAVADLREAVEILRPSQAALVFAESLVELGAAPESGDVAERRDLLRTGMDAAHRCGSWRLVSRAMSALRATGARPRRPQVTGLQALTPQERRVAQLAATDIGNREIAEQLFLTRRTVELHLTHTYRKLGISGRAELRPALAP
ncbi:AAA family ATPase [Gordonia sp. Z-3]|uniref:ATP-binding protein n=1 Tax=Gordonia sp. Z-3 TaxID=3115408 RepID=UPI002E2948F0|nr:AAA family ATPase [Gordonia sp. Z-3]MED5803904.1 AAA family ATPase [Gordonia sp. Z-3]